MASAGAPSVLLADEPTAEVSDDEEHTILSLLRQWRPRYAATVIVTHAEARAIVIAGLLGGLVTGALIAAQLVKVLTGIFDPAPQHPAIPWTFLGSVLVTVLTTGALATSASARWAGRVDASRLRDL